MMSKLPHLSSTACCSVTTVAPPATTWHATLSNTGASSGAHPAFHASLPATAGPAPPAPPAPLLERFGDGGVGGVGGVGVNAIAAGMGLGTRETVRRVWNLVLSCEMTGGPGVPGGCGHANSIV